MSYSDWTWGRCSSKNWIFEVQGQKILLKKCAFFLLISSLFPRLPGIYSHSPFCCLVGNHKPGPGREGEVGAGVFGLFSCQELWRYKRQVSYNELSVIEYLGVKGFTLFFVRWCWANTFKSTIKSYILTCIDVFCWLQASADRSLTWNFGTQVSKKHLVISYSGYGRVWLYKRTQSFFQRWNSIRCRPWPSPKLLFDSLTYKSQPRQASRNGIESLGCNIFFRTSSITWVYMQVKVILNCSCRKQSLKFRFFCK